MVVVQEGSLAYSVGHCGAPPPPHPPLRAPTVEQGDHHGAVPETAAVHEADQHEEEGREGKDERGDDGSHDGKEHDAAEVPEEVPLLEVEACGEDNGGQEAVEEYRGGEAEASAGARYQPVEAAKHHS